MFRRADTRKRPLIENGEAAVVVVDRIKREREKVGGESIGWWIEQRHGDHRRIDKEGGERERKRQRGINNHMTMVEYKRENKEEE